PGATGAVAGISKGAPQRPVLVRDSNSEDPVYSELLPLTASDGARAVLTVGAEAAGLWIDQPSGGAMLRLGYDLFDEVRGLLREGQPVEYAHIPTLDLHIDLLRRWILRAGIPLVEIPPAPAGHDFIVCLTHDIDFIGIRRHVLDHSMWGFVY